MEKIKILFIASNPTDTGRLNLDSEFRGIQHTIRSSRYRERIQIEIELAATPADIIKALNTHRPTILHFCGHGSKDGMIVCNEDGLDASMPIPREALAGIIDTLKDAIRVVFLNACHTENQALIMKDIVDCTIGMRTSIQDKPAIDFASIFYHAIASGGSMQTAFNQGIQLLRTKHADTAEIPVLYVRDGLLASEITLIDSPEHVIESHNSHQITIKGFTKVEADESKVAGWLSRFTHDITGIEFVLIPSGRMSARSRKYKNMEIAPFLISVSPVTQGVWRKVMRTAPWAGVKDVVEGDNYPAVNISWDDCTFFASQAGLFLLKEEQWEYAYRAGSDTMFFWGPDAAEDYAWFKSEKNTSLLTCAQQVMQKKPNDFGLYDMAGNVWEWCLDAHNDKTDEKIIRGGSVICDSKFLTANKRGVYMAKDKKHDIGFRVSYPVMNYIS